SGEELLGLAGHTETVCCVAFSGDGRRVVSAGVDGSVRFWDAATGEEALTLQKQVQYPVGLALSPNGGRLGVAELMSEAVKVWAAEEPRPPERREQLFTWHALEADGGEAAGRWLVALGHLNWLVDARPTDARLAARRAWMHGQLAQWEPAAA